MIYYQRYSRRIWDNEKLIVILSDTEEYKIFYYGLLILNYSYD